MSQAPNIGLGSVVALWRYPVKSMMGEELNAAHITQHGLLGDRAYALIDTDGKAATAKNPRKWPHLFDFRATFVERVLSIAGLPSVRIVLPDGDTVTSDQRDVDEVLSKAVNREVTLKAVRRGVVNAEEYWPDMEGLDHRDTVTDFALPEGTFFDIGVVHLLTTATLDQLRELYPQGRFEVRRFRPNIVVQLRSGEKGFAENGWVGQTLAIGSARLNISMPCGRCVMTTLAQGDLPNDPGILRTAAQHNQVNVGVYASVARRGVIRRGDQVRLERRLRCTLVTCWRIHAQRDTAPSGLLSSNGLVCDAGLCNRSSSHTSKHC
jgi:MOSC domain-containing protein